MIGTIHSKSDQRFLMIMAAVFGLVVGLAIFLPLARVMPFGINNVIAARIVGGEEWDAGVTLLNDTDPQRWSQVIADSSLMDANRGKIEKCREAVARTKRLASCSIQIEAP